MVADSWGKRQRNTIFPDVSTRHSYVNYAKADETVNQLYGYVFRSDLYPPLVL